MIVSIVRGLGFTTERVIAEAGPRGIVIATGQRGRSLVTIVRGSADAAALRERRGWDLPLVAASEIDTENGRFTLIEEGLPAGATSVDAAWPGGAVPSFVIELAERMAAAHATGAVVGPLQAPLVFVEPEGSGLAGVAQRPLRADLGAAKPDGEARLFPVSSLTPADVRGTDVTTSDDAYRLASMVWRWRHGEDRLAGRSVADQLAILAGTLPGASSRVAQGGPVTDPLDSLLERMLDPEEAAPPGLRELVQALRT